jgi:two-component system response regulator HydG
VLRDVAATLERRDAPLLSGRTLIRLGRLLIERGRVDAANLTFERAAELTPDADAVAESRIWQAAARTDAGRLSEAESISRALLLTAAAPLQQPWIVATLARVLLWQGRVEEACSLHIDRITTNLDDEVTRVWVDSVAVKTLLAGGRVFDAGQRAAAAVALSGASTNPLAQLIALTARLRVLAAAGELTVAEATLRQVLTLARQAHTPLRGVRARVLWLDALRQAGRTHEAQRELTALRRLQTACSPLLQHGIDKALEGGERSLPRNSRQQDDRLTSMAVGLIRIAQDEEADTTAVRRLMGQAATDLQTSRAELLSSDAGPVSTILSIGAGLPTHLGPRVLTAGLTLGPETFDGGTEIGVPIRLGPRLVAALVCRWAADRSPPHHAVDTIELTAAVAASRVDAMRLSARESAERATSIPELVGVSAGISELRATIARAATAPFAVLIEGESGVGKELVARAIHQLGPRRERRFCDLNCAALPDDLLESELFGYARGAFTGAVTDRSGLFEDANGGTLFLDELADLSPRAQAKLLRALQQQEVRRLGETFSRKVDVRVIAATNREMRREALEGRFRQDLLYRLDVIRIRIPSLRDRPEDIPVLARYFWSGAAERVASVATLSHETLCALAHYPWPGNVRELQNVLAALAVVAPARGLIRPGLLPPAIIGAARITSGRLADAREQFERRFVEAALARAGGSRTRAAGELGLSRQGLLKLMSRLEIAGDKPITSAAHG